MTAAPSRPDAPVPPGKRFNPWPYGIIAAFVIFASGTISLVVIASSARSELVSRDYYEQELRYQSRLDQLRRTQFWSNRISAAYDASGRRVKISVPKEHAAIGLTGSIELYRPSAANADATQALSPDREGIQWLDATPLSPGLWKVRLQWKVGTEDYYADRSLVVAGGTGH